MPDPKTGKNRMHLDLAARTPSGQQVLIEALEQLGATRVDVGQAEVPWVVLADPEGTRSIVVPNVPPGQELVDSLAA